MKSLEAGKTNRVISPSTCPALKRSASVGFGAQPYYIKLVKDLAPWSWARDRLAELPTLSQS